MAQFFLGSFRPAEPLTSDVKGKGRLGGAYLRACAKQPCQSINLRNGILLVEGSRRGKCTQQQMVGREQGGISLVGDKRRKIPQVLHS